MSAVCVPGTMTAESPDAAVRLSALAALVCGGCGDVPSLTNFCPADIVINEIGAAFKDDWIELYNADDDVVALAGFRVSSTSREIEFEIPAVRPGPGGTEVSTALAPEEFLLLMADTYVDGELADEDLILGFDLNRDGGGVWLRAPASRGYSECDSVIYPDQHDNFTWARRIDGGEEWCDGVAPTPGLSNEGCL